jgi:hypothetical protein
MRKVNRKERTPAFDAMVDKDGKCVVSLKNAMQQNAQDAAIRNV